MQTWRAVRRLHDTGKSGWWVLISLVPFVGGIVLIVLLAQPSEGPNSYGPVPSWPPANAGAVSA